MKTITDATNVLLAAGWTKVEAKSVLKPEPITSDGNTKNSPWWRLIANDEILYGVVLDEDWLEWLEH